MQFRNFRAVAGKLAFPPGGNPSEAASRRERDRSAQGATCRAIAEAEDMERGFYTGIFGFFNGRDLDSAVSIRFMEEDERGMVYKSGGGITVMSRMEEEYREAVAKVYVPFDF